MLHKSSKFLNKFYSIGVNTLMIAHISLTKGFKLNPSIFIPIVNRCSKSFLMSFIASVLYINVPHS